MVDKQVLLGYVHISIFLKLVVKKEMFAENFNRICKERETTASAILRNLHLSTSKVTMWNNGSLPKEEILKKLANELNCEVYEFFIENSNIEDENNEKKLNFVKDEDEKEILNAFRNMDRRDKHIFMAKIYEYNK